MAKLNIQPKRTMDEGLKFSGYKVEVRREGEFQYISPERCLEEFGVIAPSGSKVRDFEEFVYGLYYEYGGAVAKAMQVSDEWDDTWTLSVFPTYGIETPIYAI